MGYLLWMIVNWYDVLILKCLWGCHDKRLRILDTEEMEKEYCDYRFYVKKGALKSLWGLPLGLLIGAFVRVLDIFFPLAVLL